MENNYFESLDKVIFRGWNVSSFCKDGNKKGVSTLVSRISKKNSDMKVRAFANGDNILSSLNNAVAVIDNDEFNSLNNKFSDTKLDCFLNRECVLELSKFGKDKIKVNFSWHGVPLRTMVADSVQDGIVMLEEEVMKMDMYDIYECYHKYLDGEKDGFSSKKRR